MSLPGDSWVAAILVLAAGTPCAAAWQVDLESGAVISGYNEVRSPGTSGTTLSLSEELSTDTAPYVRGRLTYSFRIRHTVSLLVAPLRLTTGGSVDHDVSFEGTTFPAGAVLDGTYRFDSYRLTYRYDIHRSPSMKIGLGFTGKIRDAEISLEAQNQHASKANTGFVPLLNGSFEWWFSDRTSLMVVADALAAPQGRAEDVLVALRFEPAPPLAIRVGYRLLEGGADNDEVYTFALLHYLGAGVAFSF